MKNGQLWNSEKKGFIDNFIYWFRFLGILPKKQVMLSLVYGLARIAFMSIWPFFLYQSLKDLGVKPDIEIVLNMLIVVGMLLLGAVATNKQSTINIKIIKDFTLDLIDQLWCKMNALDWLTFHGRNRVYYFDMLMVETWRLRAGVMAILESLIINSLIAALLSICIIFISWPLFLICLGGLLLMSFGHYLSTINTRLLLKEFHEAWRVQHQWIAKCVDQFDLIKMDRAYETSKKENVKNSTGFLEVNTRLLLQQARWRNVNQLLTNIVRIGVFVIGIYWVRTGVVSLDNLLLVLLLVTVVQSNVMQIPAALNNFIEAQEALKTLSNFFELKEDKSSLSQTGRKIPSIQSIVIKNLAFNYNGQLAIDNVNIDLELGKIYLWRGRNGSGKSTAAHILLGLLEPQEGQLSVNGQPLNWKEFKFLRKRFAFLNQDSPVFMGSIRENVLFGHQNSDQAWQTLHSTWLKRLLPKGGYTDRMIGDRGEGLSGGEAKRVALIRELLRTSELLILDEPLNHLDDYAIEEIKREIVEMKAKTIVIIISHQSGFENIADEIKEF